MEGVCCTTHTHTHTQKLTHQHLIRAQRESERHTRQGNNAQERVRARKRDLRIFSHIPLETTKCTQIYASMKHKSPIRNSQLKTINIYHRNDSNVMRKIAADPPTSRTQFANANHGAKQRIDCRLSTAAKLFIAFC